MVEGVTHFMTSRVVSFAYNEGFHGRDLDDSRNILTRTVHV